MEHDIRWLQRFDNFKKAFHELQEGTELAEKRELSKLEKQGLIQGFEYTHELAWNTLKDYLGDKGIVGLIGSKDSTREAFKAGLISNGETWMEMIKTRNLTSHPYDASLAEHVFRSIVEKFSPAFAAFAATFHGLVAKEKDKH
jgi:nucleotidyltransferase substrate binding protein (TIGR01987 family)